MHKDPAANTCTYIGSQDPIRDYPVTQCGQRTIAGRNYCEEHYHMVYIKGSNLTGRRKIKAIERELKILEQTFMENDDV